MKFESEATLTKRRKHVIYRAIIKANEEANRALFEKNGDGQGTGEYRSHRMDWYRE